MSVLEGRLVLSQFCHNYNELWAIPCHFYIGLLYFFLFIICQVKIVKKKICDYKFSRNCLKYLNILLQIYWVFFGIWIGLTLIKMRFDIGDDILCVMCMKCLSQRHVDSTHACGKALHEENFLC